MLMCETFNASVGQSSMGEVRSIIAVVQKMGHSRLGIKDHMAEHTIGPAEPATVLSRWKSQNQEE